MKTRGILPLLLSMAALVLVGCGDDATDPTVDEVVGTYVLTDLVVTEGNATNDLIAEGVTASITLLAGGTTTGSRPSSRFAWNRRHIDAWAAGRAEGTQAWETRPRESGRAPRRPPTRGWSGKDRTIRPPGAPPLPRPA